MKNLMIVLLLTVHGYLAFSQTKKPSENQEKTRQVTGEKKETPENNPQTQDNRFTENTSGVKRSISYKFSSVNADGDPGKGIFRYDNDTITKVTFININDFDLSGTDQAKWYRTWSDTTGATGRGRINIVEYEGKNVVVFDVRDIFADKDGFWKIPVRYVSGNLPADGKIYFYVFERIENRKDKQNSGEEIKPVVQVKPVEEIKPAVEVKPVEEIKPAEEVKPVVEVKPVEDVKPVIEIKPVEEVKPVVEVKPVEDVKPAVEIKTVDEVKPAVEVKPVEGIKPIVPAVDVKPTEEIKATVDIKPVDEVKPVEEFKPGGEISAPVRERNPTATTDRRTQTTTAQRTQSTQVRQSTSTIQSKTQATTTNQTTPAKQTQKPAATTTQTIIAKQTQTQNTTPVADNTNQIAAQKNTEIETVQRVQPATGTAISQSSFSSGRRAHGKCYSGIIELGYGAGVTEYGISNFRFNFINGFHIGPTFSLGLGIGVRRYFIKSYSDRTLVSSEVQIPVFLDLRKTFSTRTVTPYVAFGLGSSARYSSQSETTETVTEGLLLNPSAGIWFNISQRFAVFTGVAYEMQKMEYAKTIDDSHYKKNTSSVSLNVGISF